MSLLCLFGYHARPRRAFQHGAQILAICPACRTAIYRAGDRWRRERRAKLRGDAPIRIVDVTPRRPGSLVSVGATRRTPDPRRSEK